jgi:SprT-like family
MPPAKRPRLPQAPLPPGLPPKAELLDVHDMFTRFNELYFDNALDGVFVTYSRKMTLCAGTCTYMGASGGCRIALSEPILSRRPPNDTVDTLLHEMLHAKLFLKHGIKDRDGPDGHGPLFLAEAARVNAAAGSNITVYHTFRDEVDASRGHWWACDGPCRRDVKRAMNRPPSSADDWWAEHVKGCGGTFSKTHEPPPKPSPPKHGVVAIADSDLRPLATSAAGDVSGQQFAPGSFLRVRPMEHFMRPSETVISTDQPSTPIAAKRPKVRSITTPRPLACPVCNSTILGDNAMDLHLDSCLASQATAKGKHTLGSPKGDGRCDSSSGNAFVGGSVGTRVENVTRPLPTADQATLPCSSRWSKFVDNDGTIRRDPTSFRTAVVGMSLTSRRHNAYCTTTGDVIDLDAGNNEVGIDDDDLVIGEPLPRPTENAQIDRHQQSAAVAAPEEGMLDTVQCEGTRNAVKPRQLPNRAALGVSANADVVTAAAAMCADLTSDEMLDFALGIGERFHPPNVVSPPVRPTLQTVMSIAPLPDIPGPVPELSAHEAEELMSRRLRLWLPQGPREAPFASSAARLGVTLSDFMVMLMAQCKQRDQDFVLSDRACRLFLANGSNKQFLLNPPARNSSCPGSGRPGPELSGNIFKPDGHSRQPRHSWAGRQSDFAAPEKRSLLPKPAASGKGGSTILDHYAGKPGPMLRDNAFPCDIDITNDELSSCDIPRCSLPPREVHVVEKTSLHAPETFRQKCPVCDEAVPRDALGTHLAQTCEAMVMMGGRGTDFDDDDDDVPAVPLSPPRQPFHGSKALKEHRYVHAKQDQAILKAEKEGPCVVCKVVGSITRLNATNTCRDCTSAVVKSLETDATGECVVCSSLTPVSCLDAKSTCNDCIALMGGEVW